MYIQMYICIHICVCEHSVAYYSINKDDLYMENAL